MPPFGALRAFEATFRMGGIRKAAAYLQINHAVVSRHIKVLEDWFGAPLIVRSGNRLALTDDGVRYHERLAAAFAEIKLATEEFATRAQDRPLTLWCVPGLSIQWLSHRLAQFERLHAEYSVELKPTDTPANLRVHEADADIHYYRSGETEPPEGRGLRSFELVRPEIMPVASPELAAELHPKQLDSPLDLPFLHEDNDREWRNWLELNQIKVPKQLGGPRCWHAHLAIAAAREGRGVALASRLLVEDDLARGVLVPLRIKGCRPVPLGAYCMIAREDRWSGPVLRELRQFLRDEAMGYRQAHPPGL
jgi:DNA-binding transcriptional LysR family regulator